jgi:hypothetical protein
LSGTTGLLDNQSRDVFAGAFPFLTEKGLSADATYIDILASVFNSRSQNATLHIENLKGVSGEIQLRLGDNQPFGIINVGDDAELVKLCAANGFDTSSIVFTGGSLFQNLTKMNSTINLLIGAKKFTEGWNCWRVSTMGLMNVGRSEGSEIIQLFGRGVRLKGHGMSLKRSKAWQVDSGSAFIPRYISLLETLNVFGVRADYMRQFKEFLEREGVSAENSNPVTITLPVIKNMPNRMLKTLRVKGGVEFKRDAPKPTLAYSQDVGKVTLDCYAKVQFESSGDYSSNSSNKTEGKLPAEAVVLFDAEFLWQELIRYKKRKGKANLTIPKDAVDELLQASDWYTLLIPASELACASFADVKRMEKIALTLLQKYLERYCYVMQSNWESQTVGYEIAELSDEAFPVEYTVTTTDSEFETWLNHISEELKKIKMNGKIAPKTKSPLTIFGITEHLYTPMVYKSTLGVKIDVSPVALNDSEYKFVNDLTAYVKTNREQYPEVYLLRNLSGKGVGFFENSGFYPDFIFWIIQGEKQNITFIDPHGMMNEGINSPKVNLSSEIGAKISCKDCVLHSVILSPTAYADLPDNGISKERWSKAGVIFMEDAGYIADVLKLSE